MLDVMIEDCFLSDYFFDIQQRWTPYMVAYFLPDGKGGYRIQLAYCE